MERSKLILWVVVALAAGIIIWRVGFHIPEPSVEQRNSRQARAAEAGSGSSIAARADANQAVKAVTTEPNKPIEPNRAGGEASRLTERGRFGAEDANRPGGMRGRGRRSFDPNGPAVLAGGEPNGPGAMRFGMMRPPEPNGATGPGGEPLEMINLKNVAMTDIIQKIAAWTGKVVIPSDDAMKQTVTIYAPDRLPRSQALSHVYSALRMRGFIAEVQEKVIYLRATKDVKAGGFVPTVDSNEPLAALANKDAIVQKFFKLHNYRPTQMGALVQPLVGEYGYVSADETTSTLLVIDSVANLMRIERIVAEFDVPEAEQSVTQIFVIKYGDPSEIVQLLRILLGVSDTRARTGSGLTVFGQGQRGGGRMGGPGMGPQSSSGDGSQQRTPSGSGATAAGTATSVVVGQSQGPIVLIPELRRKWIIARASSETIKHIGEWIEKLDMHEPVESEYEVIPLRYATPTEVEDSVVSALRDLPGMELMPSVLIEPTEGQVIVFGRKDMRELVKKLISEIDIPPGQLDTQRFQLQYADPDQLKTYIDDLFGQGSTSTTGRNVQFMQFGGGGGGSGRRTSTARVSETVRVIAYASLKQLTVIASPENMKKIAEQVKEWDKPLDAKEVKPRIIELRNSDPVQMASLLTKLFTQEDSGGTSNIIRYIMSDSAGQQKKKIVGALYGQLTFEYVPGTKKIIVISKIPEAYDVIEELIRELDRQEMGEVPKVIQLKYADPEDLAERLNAMFNEPGTTASIRRSEQGLADYSMDTTGTSSAQRTTTGGTTTTEYRPWWTAGRRTTEEQPISNVIGKVRFVPDPHSKSILVLAPPEFMENIEKIIRELDIPGKQVMVKAVIVEIDHRNFTSLGLQLASNPGAFGTLNENAITALNQLTQLDKGGRVTTTGTTIGATAVDVRSARLNAAMSDVTALVDFLVKRVNAKVLNQQTLWTKDNKEASFFKGEKVAFTTSATSSVTAGNVQNYEFQRVGMTLAVRPSITPEKSVDMNINVILSQLQTEQQLGQPKRTEMDTKTNMIVQNGQTVMLGGILFQQDNKVQRKIPLLGDIPLAGGLFRHNQIEQRNNELIVFITPYVIDEAERFSPEAEQEMAKPMERLKEVREQLKSTADQLQQQKDEE